MQVSGVRRQKSSGQDSGARTSCFPMRLCWPEREKTCSGVGIQYPLFWPEYGKSREYKVEARATRFAPQIR